jgi:DNA repair protein RecO (recombination protein O)
MAIQKTQAIVLKTQPFRSSSLIVTFFSKDFGKIRGLAKGVRQEREMRGATYELFSHLDIVYYEKTRSDLHLVSEAMLLESYDPIRSRLDSISFASYFCELADQLTEIHDPHPQIFELLDFSLKYLASLPGKRLSRLFEIKLFNEVGWLPYLERCLGCEAFVPESGYFSSRQGGLLCSGCAPKYPDSIPLKAEPLSVLRYYTRHDFESSIKLGMSKQTDTDLELFANRFLNERLSNPLKSRVFYEKIQMALKK